ncbi:MAG: aldehyde dehydrogenase family protein, partial [Solirubrobacteraceae bacterium]|nr:aldehyde dehydrogenase family protein [Solirubrobacteraceae bacterium]
MDPSETGLDATTTIDSSAAAATATADATAATKVVKEAPAKKPSLVVRNPATGKVIAELPAITAEDVPAVVARARAVQPRWEAIGVGSRVALFKELRKWLYAHEAEFTDTLSREGGKPIEDAFYLEWIYAMSSLEYWAKVSPKLLKDKRRWAKNRLFVGNSTVERRVPHGVVGVIGPWNYPFVNSIG